MQDLGETSGGSILDVRWEKLKLAEIGTVDFDEKFPIGHTQSFGVSMPNGIRTGDRLSRAVHELCPQILPRLSDSESATKPPKRAETWSELTQFSRSFHYGFERQIWAAP